MSSTSASGISSQASSAWTSQAFRKSSSRTTRRLTSTASIRAAPINRSVDSGRSIPTRPPVRSDQRFMELDDLPRVPGGHYEKHVAQLPTRVDHPSSVAASERNVESDRSGEVHPARRVRQRQEHLADRWVGG